MAITVKELTKSREKTSTWCEIKLWARATGADAEDDAAVKAAFDAFITDMCGPGLVYQKLVYQDYHVEHAGGGIWFAEYRFGILQLALIEMGQSEFSFEIGEHGNRHMTQALTHVASFPATGLAAANYGGLIGYDPQSGNVAGCDVPDSTFAFSVSWSPPLGTLTSQYVSTLYKNRNRMNSAPWSVRTGDGQILTFDTHEVLWRGFGGRRRTSEGWGLVYQFEANANLRNQTVANIAGINKDGWDYLWFEYDWNDANPNVLCKTAVAAHVERVLYEFDFAYFQLPSI